MGIVDKAAALAKTPPEKRTQLYFRDDGGFQFRQLPVEDGFLVEWNDKSKRALRAWMLRYRLQKAFRGHNRIPADMVTISYARDILFDIFGQLGDEETATKGPGIRKKFVAAIATAKCYRHETDVKGSLIADKAVMTLVAINIILALTLLLKVAL